MHQSVVVGIDVGGVKKGFHAVALLDGRYAGKLASRDPAAIAEWCRTQGADAVGIDAPCAWSVAGGGRLCERALAAIGIRAFATPCPARGHNHPFYGWMLNGAELFRVLTPDYPLFDGQGPPARPVCFETFPHAVACALAGRTLSAKQKRVDRRRVLRQAGIVTDSLRNLDEVDAALCAVAALHVRVGTFTAYGDVQDGLIVVPRTRVRPRHPGLD